MEALLGDRQLLTFNLVGKGLCWLCATSDYSGLILQTDYTMVKARAFSLLFVYNPATFRIELMGSINATLHKCLRLADDTVSPIGNGVLHFLELVDFDPTSYPDSDSSFQVVANKITLGAWTLAYLSTPPTGGPLVTNLFICGDFKDSNQYCRLADDNLTIINCMLYTDIFDTIKVIADPTTLCCIVSPTSIFDFAMQLTGSLSAPLPEYAYSSREECEAADATCLCYLNSSCWMYNDTNVPCCIQSTYYNPLTDLKRPTSSQIFKDKVTCDLAALNCAKWHFNTVDVPCCIQRTLPQWTTEGYSETGHVIHDNLDDCNKDAQNNYCNFKGLFTRPVVTPPSTITTTPTTTTTTTNDYYRSFLENNFTSGCESLRGHGIWGGSSTPKTKASCDSDPSPNDCYSGNCNVNYCAPWVAFENNPFKFQQDVTCVGLGSLCCKNEETLVVTNGGLPTVAAFCQTPQ